MRIALISDIHSNAYAFEAVIHDLQNQSIDLTIFLGDLVYGGLYPRECLSMLMDISPLVAIKGNGDSRYDESGSNDIIRDHRYEVHCWVRDQLTESDILTIRSFKHSHHFDEGGVAIGCYHGSPKSYNNRIYADDSDQTILEEFKDVKVSVAAVGHTHVRMRKIISGIEIVNPGAIGISNDEDVRAGYGILTLGSHTNYEQRNVEYPVERYVAEIAMSSIPNRDALARQIMTGKPNKNLFRK